MVPGRGLAIARNTDRRCLLRELAEPPAGQPAVGYGGISLAGVSELVVRENLIEDNGRDAVFAVCGIHVLHGEGVEIESNRILANGGVSEVGRGPAGARASTS